MPFEGWMLAAIDAAGYNGIRQEHIESVGQELLHTGLTQISRQDFDAACRRRGIAAENFTQTDLDALENYLNR